MMGAGKTTVGRLLADMLGRRCIDTDDEIVRHTGLAIPELFATRGELGFRAVEAEVVAGLSRFDDLVLALGGGAVLSDDNVANLLLTGVIVHLDVPADVLVTRLHDEADGRPLLADGDLDTTLAVLHAARHARYDEVADLVVDATPEPAQVARAVLDWAMRARDVLTPSEHEQVLR